MNFDIQQLTQMVFSIGVCWYLLIVVSKKLDDLAQFIRDTQKESLNQAASVKEMFIDIKDLIKETSFLVHNTSESVQIQNELTKNTLARLERMDRSTHS